jgi:hypothetical protein
VQPPAPPVDGDAADVGLLDKVAALLSSKAAALSELRAMNAQARARRAAGDAGDFDDDFQNAYAAKVLEVRARSCAQHTIVLALASLCGTTMCPQDFHEH